jgi:large subunit ribosomal protein L24
MTNINPKMLRVPKHLRDAMICSSLADNLREQYGRRSIRVIKGDNVRVMRGEYTGIEGKIEKVNTQRGTLAIEGVQREKVRGGNVKVQIHASNVKIIGLNLEDKLRDNILHDNKNSRKANLDERS